MKYKIKSTGNVIAANQAFVDAHYPGDYEIVPDVAPVAPPADTRITQVAFKRRLTSTERIAIRTLAAANATAFDFMDLLDSSVVVNLDDHDVIAGITMFEQVGALPVGRASVILTSPILDSERP